MPGDDFIFLPEPQTAVHISSGDTMNITISKSCLNVFNNLAKVCLVLFWNISNGIKKLKHGWIIFVCNQKSFLKCVVIV